MLYSSIVERQELSGVDIAGIESIDTQSLLWTSSTVIELMIVTCNYHSHLTSQRQEVQTRRASTDSVPHPTGTLTNAFAKKIVNSEPTCTRRTDVLDVSVGGKY
mmetsp:Transcript_11083/g.24416  ORF Transcript_11083/g.24416 Transcript_11083/m.24416 type:complete len:104 (+) Transcript_11083:2985-3296(+)